MKRTKISIYFVFISFFTFISLFTLIIQKAYVDLMKPLNKVNQTDVTPINPELDLEVISEIEKRSNETTFIASPSSSSSPGSSPILNP